MYTLPQKLRSFECFVFQLAKWYESEFKTDMLLGNDLSKLKIFKLHFFTTAISTTSDSSGLLEIFDDFHALPYGPVESGIYENLNLLHFFRISNTHLEIIQEVNDESFEDGVILKDKITEALELLKRTNPSIIRESAYNLVELSHSWYCWSLVFDYAKAKNKFSSKIPSDLIQLESQKKFQLTHNEHVY